MENKDLCTIIAETYYTEIYKFCYAALNCDEQAAADCTQETFFILVRKKHFLNLNGNMRAWLYKTAEGVIRNYRRKEQKYRAQLPLDSIEIAVETESPAPDGELLRQKLTADEYALLLAYYDRELGSRSELAEQYGLPVRLLYKKVERIKQKLRRALRTNSR